MSGASDTPPPRHLLDRALWAVLAVVLVAVMAAGVLGSRPKTASLPFLGTLPEFSLVERSGRSVGSKDLRGGIWIADFIFTRCSGICPVLSSAMAKLEKRIGTDARVRFVSFSVDPAHDTPEVLRSYAQGYQASPRWLFLTGERAELYKLIQSGFRLAVGDTPEGKASEGELVTHSDRMVLVDGALRIRGYYHGTDERDLEALLRDLKSLEHEDAAR